VSIAPIKEDLMDSLPKLTEPTDPRATKVVILGTVFPWSEKAPWTPSGKFSVKGALETNHDGTLIRCHECGQWRERLDSKHLRRDGLDHVAYKNKHGLRNNCSLMAPALRQRMSVKAIKTFERLTKREKRERRHAMQLLQAKSLTIKRPVHPEHFWEHANTKMNCRAQFGDRLPAMTRILGHTPTLAELRVGDKWGPISYRTIEWAFGMTYHEALCAMGLVPRPGRRQRISSPTELAILKLRIEGKTYAAIAAQLVVSQGTAYNYVNKAERT